MSHSTNNTQHVIQSEIWSENLKDYFEEELMAKQYVEMISFPHGDELLIPSVGQAEVKDYVEDTAIKYSQLDTGQFRFQITEYKQSGYAITDKLKQDSFMGQRLLASFEPKMRRALEERIEADIFKVAPTKQTAGDRNEVNGGAHRFIAQGVNNVMTYRDFMYADYAFNKALVPHSGRVAFVDPSAAYHLANEMNLGDFSNNMNYEGIVRTNNNNGMRFMHNVLGFDVYITNFLQKGIDETIEGETVSNATAAVFMATAPDKKPIIGSMRQEPKVESERNKDYQRDEYLLTARYGFDLYHPESVIVVLSNTDVTL